MKCPLTLAVALLLTARLSGETNGLEIIPTGILVTGGVRRAVFEVRPPHRARHAEWTIVGEGERGDGFEVVRIVPERAQVDIQAGNEMRTLTLARSPESGEAAAPEVTAPFYVRFEQAPLRQVLAVHGELTRRTILQHPRSEPLRCSWTVSAADPQQAAARLADHLEQAGLALVPDGSRFLRVLPAALTNAVPPGAAPPAPDSASNQPDAVAGPRFPMVVFIDTPPAQVLDFYAGLIGRLARNRDQIAGPGIHFLSMTPLSEAEVRYALETLLSWHGLRIVLDDDGQSFTAERAGPFPPGPRR